MFSPGRNPSKTLSLILAIALGALCVSQAPASATSHAPRTQGAVSLKVFSLDKAEAAPGESVVARWSFTGRARRMTLVTGAPDGVMMGYSWPIRPVRNTGELSFTIPISLGTLSPVLFALSLDGQWLGSTSLLIRCDYPWFFSPRAERCPSQTIQKTDAAMQMFEGGRMIWLRSLDSVLVFYDHPPAHAAQWALFEDRFNEGDLEIEPSLAPPYGRLQPRRGFGLVWRTNAAVREQLGWALNAEQGYSACVGGGGGGWKSYTRYLNDAGGQIIEANTYYMPTTWRVVPGTSFVGCDG